MFFDSMSFKRILKWLLKLSWLLNIFMVWLPLLTIIILLMFLNPCYAQTHLGMKGFILWVACFQPVYQRHPAPRAHLAANAHMSFSILSSCVIRNGVIYRFQDRSQEQQQQQQPSLVWKGRSLAPFLLGCLFGIVQFGLQWVFVMVQYGLLGFDKAAKKLKLPSAQ